VNDTNLQAENALVEAEIARLQEKWPRAIALDCEVHTDFYALPWYLLEAFPALTATRVRPLMVACRLFFGSILLQDKLLDGGAGVNDGGSRSMRILAMQAEAYGILRTLFPSSAAFWRRLDEYLVEHAAVWLEEQSFVSRGRPCSEYSEALGIRVAIGKNGIVRLAAAGLAELANDDDLLPTLLEALNGFSVAVQMWDDLEDWKDDLRRGCPSVLLSRLALDASAEVSDQDGTRGVKRIAREIYYGGRARHVLTLALHYLAPANELWARFPRLAWRPIVDDLRRRCESTLQDVERIVRTNLKRVETQSPFETRFELGGFGAAPWLACASDALQFLLRQRQLGFGEGRDMMRYPPEYGVGDGYSFYSGDVFQRALIVDALADADEMLGGTLRAIIEDEARYLLGQRCTSGVGGWRYFPELADRPADAGVLAQVIRALLRAGRRSDVLTHCEGPVSALLNASKDGDGSFETWILQEGSAPTDAHRSEELVRTLWGGGPDVGVIANLLHALHLHDPDQFAGAIAKGTDYVEAQQEPDGVWTGRLYAGPFFASQACLRLLAAVRPGSPSASRGRSGLRRRQNERGGWCVGAGAQDGDAQSTALALLGLSAGSRAPWGSAEGEADDIACASRGLAFLEKQRAGHEAWPACGLVNVGAGSLHGSRTLSTAFVLAATLSCHRRSATWPALRATA
jgi:hypothetical protein